MDKALLKLLITRKREAVYPADTSSTKTLMMTSAAALVVSVVEEEDEPASEAEKAEAVLFAALVAKGNGGKFKKQIDLRNAVKRLPSRKEWFGILLSSGSP
jgi:hypothetical protein